MTDNVFTRRYTSGKEHEQPGHSADHDNENVSHDESEYKAIETGKQQSRFRIFYGNGATATIPYTHLGRTLTSSHQYVSLITSDGVMTLKGRNLMDIEELLLENRIRILRAFRPDLYNKPNDDAPIIHEIINESKPDALRDDASQHAIAA